ncbi:MAG: CoA transferase [Deltaproteobacteria bacterium]|nr:CoA transferase [Deltaproteobacteria bacterium]
MQVFEGVKIADFSWVMVGPTAARELAENGATIVHVESHLYPDTSRVLGPFKDNKAAIDGSACYAARNSNKYGISLNLKKSKGQEIARRLVEWADIVCESMSPGAMAKWGLDYEGCRKIKEDIIYFSTCQFGQTGPLSRYAGYGQLGAAYGGLSYVVGKKGEAPPQLYNNYPDFIAPPYIVATVAAALLHRRKTGKGMYLDQSQVEAGASFMGPALLDYMVNKRIPEPDENRDPYMAPHGIYPCRGDDRWVAITVGNEEEWGKFVAAIGKPELETDPRFSTVLCRKENEDELDVIVGGWTQGLTAEAIMQLLQRAGVPAGVVAEGEDLINDPQLACREHFIYLDHRVIGRHAYHAPAYRLSKTPHRIWKPAPCLGEDNHYVYTEILGFTDEEISTLTEEGVITTQADLPTFKPYR